MKQSTRCHNALATGAVLFNEVIAFARMKSSATLQMKLNPPTVPAISHAVGVFQIAKQSYLFSYLFSGNDNLREERRTKREKYKKKRQSSVENCRFFLAMGYKKGIFGSFAYEFELLHK